MATRKSKARLGGAGKGTGDGKVEAVPSANNREAAGGSEATRITQPSFILLSDLHAHVWAAFSRGEGGDNSRLRASMKILRRSLEAAKRFGVPWVFAGDIVHTAGYTLNVVLTELTEVLIQFPDVVKLAVWGNHDARGVGGRIYLPQTVLATLHRAVPNFIVLDPTMGEIPYKDPNTGLTYSGAGYQPRGEYLHYATPADVGVYHQTVRGTKAPNGFVLEEGIPTEELLERHRISVVGHVHHWQYLPHWNPERVVLIPGSPEHHNFGDVGDHGWWLVNVGKDLLDVEMILGGSPEFRTVDTPADVKKDGHFYRVRSVPAGQFLPDEVIAIAPTPTAIQSRDVLKGARGDEILGVWLKTEPPEVKGLDTQYLEAGRQLLAPQELGNLQSIRLTRMMLRNFCSYENETLVVTPGTNLVLGRGKDFPSNGAGKSTLFEAIFWGLFGRTTKGLGGDEVIRWGTDKCEVILDFEGERDTWIQVRRSRGTAARLEVEYGTGELNTNSIEGKSVTEISDKLAKHLGITPELFQALGYFSQERLLLFASATDGERKDMLADLIGLAAYQEASSTAQRRVSELEVTEQKVAAVRDASQRQIEYEKQKLDSIRAAVSSWEAGRIARQQAAEAALSQFTSTLPAITEQMMQEARTALGKSLVQRKQEAQATYDALEQQLAIPQQTNTPQELIDKQLEHAQAHAELKGIRTRIQEVEKQRVAVLDRMETQQQSLNRGQCPACLQPISPEHLERCLAPIKGELHALGIRAEELAREQSPALSLAVVLQQQLGEISKGVEAGRQMEAMRYQLQHFKTILDGIAKEEIEMEATARWHVDKSISEHRTELERSIQRIGLEQNPHAAEEKVRFDVVARAEADVVQRSEELIRISEQVAIFDYWRRGFSKQGIQSLLVDEVAGLFNEVRGTIFPALTQGVYDVQFSTLSQTKQGEWRERTEFQVYQRGQLVPYPALSGGQRRRVDVGVMLTLVKAVSKWMQVPGILGLLVLDEVFGFLDGSGAEGLMEALRELQEQIPAIFVVSHDPQLQALFPEVIVVEQNQDGVSRVLTAGVA